MSYVLNEEEQMLRDAAKAYLAEKSPVSELRRLRDEGCKDGFRHAVWRGMAEMGWNGVVIEEAYGGVDMGYSAAGVLLQEMGRTLTASPYIPSAILAATALRLAGTEAQKSEHLTKIANGEAVYAFAIDEAARHHPERIDTTAVKDGNGFRLNGSKRFVACGNGADMLIVVAKTEDGGTGFFLVDPKTDGVTRTMRRTVDSHVPADIDFKDVKLDGDACLSEAEDGTAALAFILQAGSACVAAEALGIAEESFDRTLTYLKERTQFGTEIGSFQGLQHRAAELLCEIELARSLVMKALRSLDNEPSQAPLWIAAAKAKATEVSRFAAAEAIQLHGGVGMTDEYEIGFFYKRAQAAGEFLGDDRYHSDKVASTSGY
ncbi:acyl-CoA dehydrogenase family protein [Hyphobacterium marinum]|uniref:Acyl-CoA dehydrogenase n=1 Tax=Hyphobacterium marinum TaxID=3116574 RepID=A0ABU7LYQ6_9PROT|nr:acyl-CoA dehydrogenase [Hyphobacterium sp. Y6023]MEE2566660.1 acyl-CoA dehydrogenase [Hyphobacterium sp. Y6023]